MDELHVDAANRPAFEEWDGDLGRRWAANIEHFESGLRAYDDALMRAAGIGTDERVLDIGCGAGQTTIAAALRARAGRSVGIDLSGPLLEVARSRAAGLDNVTFVQGDAQVYPFEPSGFDVAITRNGTMFFADRSAAFANIAAAVRPGGRLALLVWAAVEENDWLTTVGRIVSAGRTMPPPPPGAPWAFSMSDPAYVRELLEGSGWREVRLDHLSEPMNFGPSVDAAWQVLSTGLGRALEELDAERRAAVTAELRAELAHRTSDDGVVFPSAMWLVTARRG